jgi:hypothetical protein
MVTRFFQRRAGFRPAGFFVLEKEPFHGGSADVPQFFPDLPRERRETAYFRWHPVETVNSFRLRFFPRLVCGAVSDRHFAGSTRFCYIVSPIKPPGSLFDRL